MSFGEHDNFGGRAASATLGSRLPAGRPNRARSWISAGLILIVFVAGLACGAAGMRASTQPTPPASWNDMLDRIAKKIKIKYDLTEAQQASLEQIVHTHQPNLDRIRAHTLQEMRTELQQVIEETAAVLTPEQASRFRAAVEPRLDEHFPAETTSDAKPAPN